MPRRKLKHFAEMKAWGHVHEPEWNTPSELPGSWGKSVILELGCGGGDYTMALAERFPEATVVGVDIKGSRMWWGAKRAMDLKLPNAHFLRTRVENLADYFAEGEVNEIWITFPNPHPTVGNARKRLTSGRFLEIYRRILKPGGFLHLKTDDAHLFEYTREILPGEGFKVEAAVEDLYGASGVDGVATEVQTQYEKKYLKEGRKIKYVRGVQFLLF